MAEATVGIGKTGHAPARSMITMVLQPPRPDLQRARKAVAMTAREWIFVALVMAMAGSGLGLALFVVYSGGIGPPDGAGPLIARRVETR